MTYFIVYNPLDGDILRSGFCPLDWLELQAQAGEAVMEVGEMIDNDKFMVNLDTMEIIPVPVQS